MEESIIVHQETKPKLANRSNVPNADFEGAFDGEQVTSMPLVGVSADRNNPHSKKGKGAKFIEVGRKK
jgi:hypothetical protein